MRRQSRELALHMLFQMEFSSELAKGLQLQDFFALFEHKMAPELIDYAKKIAEGYFRHKDSIDDQIQRCSKNWKLHRMPLVDKNLARLATFEMKYSNEILQAQIAINEALELAKKYGSTDSASFLNGLLDCISKDL